jgi:hypothetical protein
VSAARGVGEIAAPRASCALPPPPRDDRSETEDRQLIEGETENPYIRGECNFEIFRYIVI